MKFANNIDLIGNEIRNARFHQLASAPSAPVYGQIYHNTGDGNLYIYTSAWNYLATYAQVIGTSLDKFATPTANVAMGNLRIVNLADPVNPQDATTKNYVDALLQGVEWKNPVRVVATANITLSGLQTVDGVSLAAGDRVGAIGQTDGTKNGIWVVASGAWTRSLDADANAEFLGMTFFTSEGTVNGNKIYNMTTDGPITVGTTSLTFVQIGQGTTYSAGTGINISGATISIDTSVVVRKTPVTLFGNGTATSFTINHTLSTQNVKVEVFKVSTNEEWMVDVTATSTTSVTITFGNYIPANNEFSIVIIG